MTQAQKIAKAKFKQAIAYRTKTGVSLKEAFAHIYGKKKVVKKAVKKAAPKKKVVKKATKKGIAGPKDSKLIKKELAKKGLKMPHGYATVKRKRKISGVKKKPTENQVLKSIQKAYNTQTLHMVGSVSSKAMTDLKEAMNKIAIFKKQISNHQIAIKTTKNIEHKNIYKKQLLGLKKYLSELKTHAKELKKLI